jgi:hypothetical protein
MPGDQRINYALTITSYLVTKPKNKIQDMANFKHQTVAWVDKPGPDARVRFRSDFDIPEPKDDEVLIKLECTGVWYELCFLPLLADVSLTCYSVTLMYIVSSGRRR